MKKIFLLLCFITFHHAASAAFVTGFDLNEWGMALEKVKANQSLGPEPVDAATLYGYVVGIVDSFSDVYFCAPSNAKTGQLLAVVQKFIKEHPERWNEAGSVLVVDALRQAFPCKK